MQLQTIQGVWPVMLTPFTNTGEVDYRALDELVEWYIESGVTGLFAVCQSSEMFFLTPTERVQVSAHVKRRATVPVIASGHVSDAPSQQINELLAIADTGVDAVVMLTNRQSQMGETSQVWMQAMDALLSRLPKELPLGLYECPYPYKHLLTDDELRYCASTGRFRFLKDTCCDLALIKHRLELLKGTQLKLFNANTATLLDSLCMGAEGFSGVMANFHPELYVWLCRNWNTAPEKAKQLQAGLTFAAMIEKQCYPMNAKIYLSRIGLQIGERCRVKSSCEATDLYRNEIEQMAVLVTMLRQLTH